MHKKISYATKEQAEEAARRRRQELKMAFKPYKCRMVRPNSIHPVLRQTHWHITKNFIYRSEGHRTHEEWNPVLGTRVAGCLIAENSRSEGKRMTVLIKRANAAVDKLRRVA